MRRKTEGPRVVCAWCGDELHPGAPGAMTSHTICPACARGLEPEDESCTGCGRADPDYTDDRGRPWHQRCHRRRHRHPARRRLEEHAPHNL